LENLLEQLLRLADLTPRKDEDQAKNDSEKKKGEARVGASPY